VGDSGRILVRLPVAAMEPWEIYGTDWVALDPPRHLSVPSVAGMYALAARCNLEIESWWCDATGSGWWASELASRGIPHMSARADEIMTDEQRRHFARVAADANRRRVDDTAGFVLRRAATPSPTAPADPVHRAPAFVERRRRVRRPATTPVVV